MPELPEVETMRRGILPIVGSRISGVSLPPCSRRPIQVSPSISRIEKHLVGKRITAVSRAGKRVVVETEGDWFLIFEPRMTGLVLVSDPPSSEHLRFCLELEEGPHSEIWFWDRRGLGSVTLLDTNEFRTRILEGKLGPDALAITPDEMEKRLGSSSREIKVALLDQRAIAGIGNLYASEILHLAKLHPQQRCSQLTSEDFRQIHHYMREVLLLAIKHEGSTLSDGTYRNALNQSGGYQNHHRVYDREKLPCPSCKKGVIVRMVQSQRATFYCPDCQQARAVKRRASKTTPKKPAKRKPASQSKG